MLSRRIFLAASAAALALTSALATAPTAALAHGTASFEVHDPYARALGGAGSSGAVFLHLTNTGHHDDRLIGARTDVAEKAELHTHIMTADGVMQMREIEGGIAIAAGETHVFQRGSDHIMLMGLTRALAPGETFSVTLIFESGAEVAFDVAVDNDRKAEDAAMPMQGMDGMEGMEGHDHSKMGSGG